ncbi:uncharacterized protein LOC6550006 [Drosophila erecta]|uniref:Uncharacterized protein n=1 Tax=Drosophila erecta TaxID=7220 RepID=B3NVK7_DROER|nr:uncharacterized protein LOC6550006 [Drosophila erecta]EDV46399.1 uncharacterized protein Dere_GG18236 [Drosophila erecta]
MCMPYLSKLFGSGDRRQRRTQDVGITPLPSLANVTQVSMNTVKSAKSAKSAKSGKSAKSTSRRSTAVVNPSDSSVSSIENYTEQPTGTASRGVVRNTSASVPTSAVPADEAGALRSWWEYFGMSKNKKPSIDSL